MRLTTTAFSPLSSVSRNSEEKMADEFKLPDIGEGLAEGEIVKWLVGVGDTVTEDQPLVEVMTDKATVEIPSPRAGTVEALTAAEGDVVEIGTTILVFAGESAGETAASTSEAAMSVGAEAPAPQGRTADSEVTRDQIEQARETARAERQEAARGRPPRSSPSRRRRGLPRR